MILHYTKTSILVPFKNSWSNLPINELYISPTPHLNGCFHQAIFIIVLESHASFVPRQGHWSFQKVRENTKSGSPMRISFTLQQESKGSSSSFPGICNKRWRVISESVGMGSLSSLLSPMGNCWLAETITFSFHFWFGGSWSQLRRFQGTITWKSPIEKKILRNPLEVERFFATFWRRGSSIPLK